MKRLPFLFACIIAFISASVISASAADVKIGVMDTQKIIVKSEKITKYRAEYAQEIEAKRQEYLKKRNDAQELEKELNEKAASMTSEVQREKADRLRKEARDLKRMEEEIKAEMQAKEADMTRKFLLQIKDVAVEYLKKEKLTLILETGSVVASDDAVDITDQILKAFDSKK